MYVIILHKMHIDGHISPWYAQFRKLYESHKGQLAAQHKFDYMI